jgi:hypothetical protein
MSQMTDMVKLIKKKYGKKVFTAPKIALYMNIIYGYPKASTINNVSRLYRRHRVKKSGPITLIRRPFRVKKNGITTSVFFYCIKGQAKLFNKLKYKPAVRR